MLTNQAEETLMSPHTEQHNATQQEIFEMLALASTEEYVHIEYHKIPSRRDLNKIVDGMYRDIKSMPVEDLVSNKLLKRLSTGIKEIRGERKSEFYRPSEDFRNSSGYLLFIAEDGSYKSVDIRNIISITINGTKLIRPND